MGVSGGAQFVMENNTSGGHEGIAWRWGIFCKLCPLKWYVLVCFLYYFCTSVNWLDLEGINIEVGANKWCGGSAPCASPHFNHWWDVREHRSLPLRDGSKCSPTSDCYNAMIIVNDFNVRHQPRNIFNFIHHRNDRRNVWKTSKSKHKLAQCSDKINGYTYLQNKLAQERYLTTNFWLRDFTRVLGNSKSNKVRQ